MYKVRVEWIPDDPSLADVSGMVIGGSDHNFPRVDRYAEVINEFLARVAVRWPEAIFYVDNDPLGRGVQRKLRKRDLPAHIPDEGTVIIVRDEEMDSHEDREGAVPMPDGESSLVLWFNPNPRDPAYHYLDLVTADNWLENDFAWWAVEQLWDVYLEAKRRASLAAR
jgi:hypothetical protein